MKPKIRNLQPPLLSALFLNIRLLSEHVDLLTATVDDLRKKYDKVESKVEQTWNLQASLTDREGEKTPVLLVEVALAVEVTHKDTQVKLATYHNQSRATFEVIG